MIFSLCALKKLIFRVMSSSDDSDCEGLKKASSMKKTEPTYEIVPEKEKFKFEIVNGKGSIQFAYKLKKGTALPYKTILEGCIKHF